MARCRATSQACKNEIEDPTNNAWTGVCATNDYLTLGFSKYVVHSGSGTSATVGSRIKNPIVPRRNDL